MGKVNLETGSVNTTSSVPQSVINHASHLHPLHLTNYQTSRTLSIASCAGCMLAVSSDIFYTCTTCNYHLHVDCSQMPNQITHPCHQNHVLSLLHKPTYVGGIFSCDACQKHGSGFAYNCKACEVDLHMLCALMPLVVSHQSHPHQLNLAFSPPYADKTFSCDVCRTIGGNHWLYRCDPCGFDVHLDCATKKVIQSPQQTIPSTPNVQYQQFQNIFSRSVSQPHAMGIPHGVGGLGVTPPSIAHPGSFYGGAIHSFANQGSFNGGAIPSFANQVSFNGGAIPSFANQGSFNGGSTPSLMNNPGGLYGSVADMGGTGIQGSDIMGDVANGMASAATQTILQDILSGGGGGGGSGSSGGGFDMSSLMEDIGNII